MPRATATRDLVQKSGKDGVEPGTQRGAEGDKGRLVFLRRAAWRCLAESQKREEPDTRLLWGARPLAEQGHGAAVARPVG
jgi:hypothetical protein